MRGSLSCILKCSFSFCCFFRILKYSFLFSPQSSSILLQYTQFHFTPTFSTRNLPFFTIPLQTISSNILFHQFSPMLSTRSSTLSFSSGFFPTPPFTLPHRVLCYNAGMKSRDLLGTPVTQYIHPRVGPVFAIAYNSNGAFRGGDVEWVKKCVGLYILFFCLTFRQSMLTQPTPFLIILHIGIF